MKLIRKFNPKAAPFIPAGEGGKPVHRILALVKDDVFAFYVCFYDSITYKVYVESIRLKHGASTSFNVMDCWQIESDKEWLDVINFLKNDECQVIQLIEDKFEKINGELQIHNKMFELPLNLEGVDASGSTVITKDTPFSVVTSPSLY